MFDGFWCRGVARVTREQPWLFQDKVTPFVPYPESPSFRISYPVNNSKVEEFAPRVRHLPDLVRDNSGARRLVNRRRSSLWNDQRAAPTLKNERGSQIGGGWDPTMFFDGTSR